MKTMEKSKTLNSFKGNIALVTTAWTTPKNITKIEKTPLNFDKYDLSKKGLLAEILLHQVGPIKKTHLYYLERFLEYSYTNDPNTMEILNTPAEEVYLAEIDNIHTSIVFFADHIILKPAMDRARELFTNTEVTVGDQTLVDYKVRVSHENSPKKTKKKLINEEKLLLLKYDNLSDLYNKSEKQMLADSTAINEACWDILSTERNLKNHILDCHKKAQSSGLTSKQIERLPAISQNDDIRLGNYFTKTIVVKEYYIYSKIETLAKQENKSIRSAFNKAHRYTEYLKEQYPNRTGPDMMLSPFYFSPVAILAASILILNLKGKNVKTILRLKSKDIEVQPNHIHILGFKSKTNMGENTITISKQHNPRYYDLIIKLLNNRKNLDKYWANSQGGDVIFATSTRTRGHKKQASQLHCSSALIWDNICSPYGLAKFTAEQIRDLYHSILYMKTKNPFAVMQSLGHLDIQTTEIYLNKNLWRVLGEANINQFTRLLSESIKFELGSDKQNKSKDVIDPQKGLFTPLFHIGEDEDEEQKSQFYKWFHSKGEYKISIGPPELEHLKYQINFYSDIERFNSLRSTNSKRFATFHLPRILFCLSLKELLKTKQIEL